MSYKTIDLTCPGCGAPVSINQKVCEYCDRPVLISSFNSVYSMSLADINKYKKSYIQALGDNPDNPLINSSIAMCYLKLRLYDKALESFEKAIEDDFDNSETYFYAAVSLLKGKKAFLTSRVDINKAIEYINAALMIEPKGIYYYFLAYIKYDFFERKFLNTTPDFKDCYYQAMTLGTSDYDINMLFDILNVSKPSIFN